MFSANPKSQSGVSLFLAIIIMTILLAIALGLSTIFVSQMRISQEIDYSLIAFYAAEAGIEKVLVNRENPSNIPETFLANGASYQVFVTTGGVGECLALNYCIKSVGVYKGISRAIEISY